MNVHYRPNGVSLMRLAVWLASTSLSLSLPLVADAQPAAPQQGELAGQPNTDPPAIAGSLAAIAGSVSFHAAGETQWSAATLNYPVTNGEGFWTEAQASATIDIADDRLVLDESTELDVTTLDQTQFVATEAQGAIFFQLNSMAQGQTLTLNTPRGSVQISQAGTYEIVAGDTNDATMITVVTGAAHISGANLSLDVGPQQTATIGGTDTLQGSVGAMQQDAFLKTQLQLLEQQRRIAVPQEVRYMTGAQNLASYGTYTQTAEYGQVWYPRDVPTGWAPYRDGHWAYVQPWGWNWVDNDRWGFAPFHYGRWAQIGGRWGWIPGGGAAVAEGGYPVYSPALVSFIGVAGAGLGFSIGVGGFAPAWVPLGWHEPYYPWYHCRQDYFARVNSYYGVPRTIIERGPTYINNVNVRQTNIFINRGAATVVPAADFARGGSIMRFGHPVPERAFADARPLGGRLPVTPTAFTPNLPLEAAHRFNIAQPLHPIHAAAGPRILAVAPGAHVVPELRRAALPQNIHAVPAAQIQGHTGAIEPPHPGGPGTRPELAPGAPHGPLPATAGHGLPTLRAPGARPEALPAHPGASPGEIARPGEAGRPGLPPAEHAALRSGAAVRPDTAARPETERHVPSVQGEVHGAPPSAHETARPVTRHDAAPRSAIPPRPEAARPEPHVVAHHEVPRPEVHAAPHVEAPRPHIEAPHQEAPHPAARHEPPHKEAEKPHR